MNTNERIDTSYVLAGGGKAGALLRAIDWNMTAVGSVENWPASLKSAVRLVLDNGSPVYISWGESRSQFYNDAYLPIFGEDKFNLGMGQDAKITLSESWCYVKPMWGEVMNGSSQIYQDFMFLMNRDGLFQEVFFSFSSSPLRDDSGKIVGMIVIAQETTERVVSERRLLDEREKLHLIADRLPAFVSYIGDDGKYKFVNSAYSKLSGKARFEIEGKSRRELLLEQSTYDYMESYQQKAFSGERVRYELNLVKSTGEEIIIDTEYLPDLDPETKKVRGILCVGQDITERKKALLEAQKAQKELREIFMQTPLPLAIMTGVDHIFNLANPYYVQFVGRDVLGKSVLDVFNRSAAEKFIPILDKVYQSGESVMIRENHFKIQDKDKIFREHILNIEYHPYKDSNGLTIGVMTIIHNVTDQVVARKKVEESEERYRSLADTIPQLMWTSSKEGYMNYANQRCLEYSGMDSQKKYAENWAETIHPYDLPTVSRSWLSSMKSGKSFKEEYRIRRVDGKYRWFLGRAIPVKNYNGDILYWNGTATDIEEHKRIERELEEAKEIAENANATKSAFLANMSHEIRTPLGAILGFSELLKNSNITAELRDRYIETICRNGQSLTRIIDDILDLAKVEAGKLDVEHIDFSLTHLLNEVIDLLKQKASQKDIYLKLVVDPEVPTNIYSDPTRLRQIFINIIGNAVKFTDIGGVVVHLQSVLSNDGTLKISVVVTDTGRGLDEEQKSRLFEPFTQADNTTTRRYGGTGLGLALSKRLSEALGGTITINKYEKDRGCTFTVSFVAMIGKKSLEQVDHLSNFLYPSHNLPLKGMRILFADDSPDNQFLVEHFLNLNGAEVALASDGSEAVDKALAGFYDLVLMDIQMPKMDGYQAAKILMNRGYKAPIVALTAHAMAEEREKTRNMGFTGHLTKPFNFNELLLMVAAHSTSPLPLN